MKYIPKNLSTLVMSTPNFDDLTLTGTTTANGGTFTIWAISDEFSLGKPEPVDTAVQRWMIDGAIAATQGYDNREVSFRVLISASNTTGLNAGEAALSQREGKTCLLAWTPPEGSAAGAPVSVFEVWTWHIEPAFDATLERHTERLYVITATAKPRVRSLGRTSVAATSTGATTTSIDACTATTGWTGYWGDLGPTFFTNGTSLTVTTSGGANHISKSVPDRSTASHIGLIMTRTGSVTGLGSTPFIRIDETAQGASGVLIVTADGTMLQKVASSGSLTWFALPAGVTSFSTLTILATYDVQPHKTPTLKLDIADVSATSSANPGIGTGKQLVRSLAVGGSAPTTGSIVVASPSASVLGTVVVYTYADNGSGYIPAMRSYKTAGQAATADLVNTVSGAWERIDNALTANNYTIPPNILREATYAVVVRARCATATRQPFTVTSAITGVVSPGSHILTSFQTFAAANTWEWHVLGAVTLPPVPVPAESSATVVVGIQAADDSNTNATAEVDLDEMYLFDITNGDLSMATVAASMTRLWVDSADYDPSRNRPVIYQGTQDDRSDAGGVRYDRILAIDEHRLDPNGAAIFTVTDGVAGAAVSATFYHRWHSNAGD